MRDKLFMIQPGFVRGNSKFYCPDVAMVAGYLALFPEVARHIDIEWLPFERPRNPIIELLGEENQSMPVLILAEENVDWLQADKVTVGDLTRRYLNANLNSEAPPYTYHFYDNIPAMLHYLAIRYNTPFSSR